MGTRYHLAVVGGPDVGWVVPLPEDRDVVVGRGEGADLVITDGRLSRRHLAVRMRRGRLSARTIDGGRAGVRLARRRRSGRTRLGRRRPLRGRSRLLSPGSQLAAGGSLLEVRDHPGLASEPPKIDLADGLGMRLLVPLAMSATVLPMALSGGATSPWRTVAWLVLPLVLVVSVLWPWLRERATRRHGRSSDTAPEPPEPLDPAGLLAVAGHPGHAGADWDLGTEPRRRPRRTRRRRTLPPPSPGQGLALVGPPAACRAMARWLVCQAAHHAGPEGLVVELPPSWDWAAPLRRSRAGTTALRVIETTSNRGVHTEPASDAVGLLLAPSLAEVPTWCTKVIEVDPTHDRQVSEAWAHEVALALARSSSAAGGLPDLVLLSDLVGDPSPEEVLRGWQRPHEGLAAPLGMGSEGPLWLDLAAAGPHALVAGTTGAGKSELLTTWVLGIAIAHAPREVQVLLIDYKGGATFGALAELPHVVDVLTDLDTGTTARALASLRAELARRERVLAEAGARSLGELRSPMPRLLVIVDEFRTLADSHPDLLDALVRLAAQGRSLGIHLVLATQRPGGAVTADMRANLPARICLRVLEPTDSHDVLGDDSAAHLPPLPGRAVVRTDAAVTVQVAWPGTLDDGVARSVSTIRLAARAAEQVDPGLVRVQAPWAPPLPAVVQVSELPESHDDGLPLLLVDLPEQQRVATRQLEVPDTLLISGPPRSGRTSAARTVAVEAVRRGIVTHAVAADKLLPGGAPAAGTWCPPEDVRRVHLLLQALQRPRRGRELLVVDDVEAMCRALDAVLPFGSGVETMLELLRSAHRRSLGIVLTAPPPAARWAAAARSHLVLAPRDASDALVAGVPRKLVDLGAPPGRGVLLDGATALVGQVALAGPGPWPAVSSPPLRIEPLPTLVALPPTAGHGRLLVGLGDLDGGPVTTVLPEHGTLLVLGGPRTGRTTALRMLTARLRAAGRMVWTDPATVTPGAAGALVVDDAERLSPTAATAAAQASTGIALLAAARPDPLGSAFHEVARRLRDPDVVLVLGPAAGTAPWTGVDVRPLADPDHHPGRGVLVSEGSAVALQVDKGASCYRTVPEEDGLLVAATDAGSSSPTPTTSEAASIG